MKVDLVSHENDKAVFTVELDEAKFEEAINKAYFKIKKQVNIPGFRKGHAPRKIIEANYGVEIFYEDALDILIPEAYEKGITELELEPIDQPSVDVKKIEKNQPVTMEFKVETKPIPELGNLEDVEITKLANDVKDEEIDRVLKQEQNKNVIETQVDDRPAELGDKVKIDFKGFVNDEAFAGGEAEDYDLLLGSNTFIPGFEDQIVNHEVGEEFDVNVKFPEDYNQKDLAGKDAVFKIKLKSITKSEYPDLDDEFAKDVSEFDTLDEYKDSIRKDLEERKAKDNEIAQQNEAIENLIKISKVNAPKAMVEHELSHQVEDMENQLKQMGMDMKTYAEYINKDIEALKEDYRPKAEMRVKVDLVIDAIVDKENFEISDEEIENEYEDLAKSMGLEKDAKEMQTIRNDQTKAYIITNLKRRKAVDLLVEKAKVVEKKEEVQAENDKEEAVGQEDKENLAE